jgi:CRP-like cAMP-binding protein
MARLADVKSHAVRLFAKGEPMHALRLFDSIVAAAPLHYEARLRVADCLAALGEQELAVGVFRAVGWYALKSGHPLTALVCARVLESMSAEFDDLQAAMVMRYGSESEFLGKFAARINTPGPDTEVVPPNLHEEPAPGAVQEAARRAIHCLDDFEEYPETLHPIPLLSSLSEAAFRRVLGTLLVKRLPAGSHVIREGEPGHSFFFVASGVVRVYTGVAPGEQRELARLHENTVFGEMALLSAMPRSASVEVVGEADLLEVTRESLAALADELEQVANALHAFTRDRLLRNLMATSPLFRPFNRAQQRDLLRRFTSHEAGAGTDIIREGNDGRGLFLVLQGEVDVHKRGADGSETTLATLRAGDVFGEMALIRGGKTTATVTAARPSTVLFLAREYVERMVSGIPAIKEYLHALADDRQLETQLAMDDDDELGEDEEIILI